MIKHDITINSGNKNKIVNLNTCNNKVEKVILLNKINHIKEKLQALQNLKDKIYHISNKEAINDLIDLTEAVMKINN